MDADLNNTTDKDLAFEENLKKKDPDLYKLVTESRAHSMAFGFAKKINKQLRDETVTKKAKDSLKEEIDDFYQKYTEVNKDLYRELVEELLEYRI